MGVATLVAAGCQAPRASTRSQVSYQVNSCLRPTCEEVPVRRGDVNASVSINGSLRYAKRADLSFGSVGTVAGVHVSVGDEVKKGQLLAELEPSFLQLAVIEARMDLREAEEGLDELLKPVTSAELLNAETAVSAARKVVIGAERALKLAKTGATERELAEAALVTAEISVQEAEKALESAKAGPTEREFAEAKAAVISVKFTLQLAEDRLATLREGTDPPRARETEIQVTLAEANLKEAQQSLGKLKLGPDAEVVSQRRRELVVAEIALLRSRLALSSLTQNGSSNSLELKLARAQIDLAQKGVDRAELALQSALAGPTEQELAVAEATLIAAEISLQQAQEALQSAEIEPTDRQLAEAEATVAASKSVLQFAEERLAKLRKGPDPLLVRDRESRLALAQADSRMAQERLVELESGADPVVVSEKQRELDSSRDALIRAEQYMAHLANGADEMEVGLRTARVEAARAALAAAEEWLKNATITAPFRGRLSAVNVHERQAVREDTVVLQLIDTSALEMIALVNEIDAARLREGQVAHITTRALSDTPRSAHVVSVSPVLGEDVDEISYEVVVSGQQLQSANLREGVTAMAEIIVEQRRNVLTVPVAALRGEDSEASVAVVKAGNVSLVRVTPGLDDGTMVEVTGELHENDVVRVQRVNLISLLGR